MSQCQPRKFSERMALINKTAKQGNADFNSIINEVRQMKPTNSGSELDKREFSNEVQYNSNMIDENLSSNEHIKTIYTSDHHKEQMLNYQYNQSNQQKNELSSICNGKKQHLEKNQIYQGYGSCISNYNSLQLPGQTDTFRRAHSDSSIPLSITTFNNPNSSNDCGVDLVQNNQQYSNDQNYSIQQYPQFQSFVQYPSHNTAYQVSYQTSPSNTNNSNSILNDKNKSSSNSTDSISNNPNDMKRKSITSLGAPNSPTLQIQFKQVNSPQALNITNNHNATTLGSVSSSNESHKVFFTDGFKNEPVSPIGGIQVNNFSHNYNQSNASQSQLSTPSLPSPSHLSFNFNHQSMMVPQQPQITAQQFQGQSFQLQLHQQQQRKEQHLYPNSTNTNSTNNNVINNNSNYLNANIPSGTGGSLPDLSFQYQTNQLQQNIQLQEYNIRNQQSKQHCVQLLQPNFQQHDHIGPVKPTHDNSVSPTRASARYSPTNIGHNSIANRRPSPQHLGLNRQVLLGDSNSVQSSPTTPYVSSPNSPLHPSMHSLESLEFTINSQQLNKISQTTVNGVPQNTKSRSKTNNNMNTNESLPPSPLSQHSYLNSPQGSPDPSISPQDLNFFNPSNPNYDLMHKKFDSINLENNNQQGYSIGIMQYSTISPTQGSPQVFPPTSQYIQNTCQRPNQMQHLPNQQAQPTIMSPTGSNPQSHSPTYSNANNGMVGKNLSNNANLNLNSHDSLGSNNFDSSGEAGSIDNQSTINSRSGSLSSSSSVNNNLMEDESQNSQNTKNTTVCQPVMNRDSINSIPNIIFTEYHNTTEDKTEAKDLLIYDENYLQKNGELDFDLELLVHSNNNVSNDQILYQYT